MPLILVIDDDRQVRRMVRRILTQANHEVIEAEDGEAGLELLRTRGPALVVTDLIMPKKEGIETIRDIRLADPATKVIAMSGSHVGPGANLYLHAAEKLGADAILPKPFLPAELLQAVSRLLGVGQEN